jgi:sulfopyruvate decarboxylase subunit beta
MELVAKSMGIEKTRKVQSEKELRHALESLKEKEAPMFVHVMVKPGNANVNNIPMSPVEIKQRFMKALRE